MKGERMTMTRTTVNNVLKVLIIGALVAISAGALFEVNRHEFVNNTYSPEYKDHKSKYSPINIERRRKQEENRSQLQELISNGDFTSNQKIALQKIHDNSIRIQETSNIALEEYTKKKKSLQKSYKYRGYNGYFFFRLALDRPLMSLVMGLLLLYVIFNPIAEKWKKLVFSLFTSIYLFTATFFVLQALYAQMVFNEGFPRNWYSNMMLFIPILVAFILPLLFYHYQTIETKLRNYVKSIFTYIYDTTDDIKQEKQKEHQLKRGELINKGLKIDE